MVLNLLSTRALPDCRDFFERSFARFQATGGVEAKLTDADTLEKAADKMQRQAERLKATGVLEDAEDESDDESAAEVAERDGGVGRGEAEGEAEGQAADSLADQYERAQARAAQAGLCALLLCGTAVSICALKCHGLGRDDQLFTQCEYSARRMGCS